MMEITRRKFLKGTAAGAGIAALAGVHGKVLVKSAAASTGAAGEHFVNSTCRQCPARCGIRVRVVNGKAVKIDSNPIHPINNYLKGDSAGQGGLCPKGAGGLDQLYDPDRIKGPMKRTNPKKGIDSDPKFVPVTWDEALDAVAGKMKKMRDEGKAKTLVTMYGRGMGSADAGALNNFITVYGSPNMIGHGSICAEGSKVAKDYMEGQKTYSNYDYDNSTYLLVFGANLIEAFRPLSLTLRSYGHMRQGKAHRTKIVYFDTRPTVTGAKADEAYIVNPATDGAIALGMVHTILTEGRWNRKFVGDFKDGTNQFATGKSVEPEAFEGKWTSGLIEWWNTIVKDFTPDKAAQISGVPAADIKRLAREFAAQQPGGCAIFERGPTAYQTGVANGMCIHALNGLIGAMYAPGGLSEIQAGPPLGAWPASPDSYMDAIALKTYEVIDSKDPKTGKEKKEVKATEKKFPKFQDVADAQEKGDPYKAGMFLTWMTNPAFSPANPQRFWKAFEEAFVVTTTSWIDDTSIFADYILPDPSYLESLYAANIYPSLGYPCSSLLQPVVPPLYDTKSLFWILSELGKRIGGQMAEYYKNVGSLENVMSALIKGAKIDDAKPGEPEYKIGWTLDQWKEKGVWYKAGPQFAYAYANGAFTNTKDGKVAEAEEIKEKVFKTPSGKFEFRSGVKARKIAEKVEKALDKEGVKDKKEIEAKVKETLEKKEKDLYPQHKEPEWFGGPGFDLHLNTGKMVHTCEGRGMNSPAMLESWDIVNNQSGGTTCWMHPDTARARGIKANDAVIIESPLAKIKARALLNAACNPKVVQVPFSFGHKKAGEFGYGKYATQGTNPNELMKNLSDPDSNLQSYFQTMVKVSKA